MVSTRSAASTPRTRSKSRTTTPSSRKASRSVSSPTPKEEEPEKEKAVAETKTAASHRQPTGWSHTPSNLVLVWLAVAIPLVIWDTVYILFRPWTMPGGSMHWPIYVPYALYGAIDYVYGWPAYHARDGFPSAQGALNAIETAAYMYYFWVVISKGKEVKQVRGRGAPRKTKDKDSSFFATTVQHLFAARVLGGKEASMAVLICFSASVMTVSKTVLYWLSEYFSGFQHIGHNEPSQILFLWILPNGAWLVLPTYMIYVLGQEILQGLNNATGSSKRS